jgi:hypothetical protein
VAIALQAIFAWVCTEPTSRERLLWVFTELYRETPGWTAFLLGLNKAIWLLPALSVLLLALALWHTSKAALTASTIVAVAVLVGMAYAVYPIHLMVSRSVV